MKSVLIGAVMTLALNAFAIDANSSWQEIFSSKKTDVRLPQVSFNAGEVTSFLSIEKLCFTATQIKTIEAQNVYSQVNSGKDKVDLVTVGKEILATNRTYTKSIPGSSDHDTVQIVVTIPSVYNVDVYSVSTSDHNSGRKLFTKALSLPACQ